MEVDCHNKLPHHTLTALLIKSLACNLRQQHLVSAYHRGTSQNPRQKKYLVTGEDVSTSVSSLVISDITIPLYKTTLSHDIFGNSMVINW